MARPFEWFSYSLGGASVAALRDLPEGTVNPKQEQSAQHLDLGSAAAAHRHCYVMQCSASADGSVVAAALSNNTVKLYRPGDLASVHGSAAVASTRAQVQRTLSYPDRNAATSKAGGGKRLGSRGASSGCITECRFSPAHPDGALLYACSTDGTLAGWDTRVRLPPVTSSVDGGGGAWAAGQGAVFYVTAPQRSPVACFDVGCGGMLIAAGTDVGDESAVLFWDVRSQRLLGKFEESHNDAVTQLRFAPAGSGSAAAAASGAAGSPGDAHLLTASVDGLVCWFDTTISGEEVRACWEWGVGTGRLRCKTGLWCFGA